MRMRRAAAQIVICLQLVCARVRGTSARIFTVIAFVQFRDQKVSRVIFHSDGHCARLLKLPDIPSWYIVVSSFVRALSYLRSIRVTASMAQVKQLLEFHPSLFLYLFSLFPFPFSLFFLSFLFSFLFSLSLSDFSVHSVVPQRCL